MGASDHYCLRWNNHRKNFDTVMHDLLENQTLTDVTLGVEDGRFLNCHKVILATCSPYFLSIFIEVPCNHPIILLKDVGYTEVKAILDFMYMGEVSVARDDMAALLEVAELLKVKGLVAGNELSTENESVMSPSPTVCSTSGNRIGEASRSSENPRSTRRHSTGLPACSSVIPPGIQDVEAKFPIPNTRPMSQVLPSEDQRPLASNLTNFPPFLPRQSFPVSQYRDDTAESMTGQNFRNDVFSTDTTRNQDTPILRAVLNPDNDDGSTRLPKIRQDSHDSQYRIRSNESANNESNERRGSMDLTHSHQSPSETDASVVDEEEKRAASGSFSDDAKHGSTSYGSAQKQEVKRYKKYTRNDIWNAIEAVRGGLSANKAAELFNVPSRTLYDKIKKLRLPSVKHRRGENISTVTGSQYDTGGNLSSVGMENISINPSESTSEPTENPTSMVETTHAKMREKSTDCEETMDVSQKSSSPRVSHDNSRPQSPGQSPSKDDENEAEDLSVSRRSNVRVIVPPSGAIQETA